MKKTLSPGIGSSWIAASLTFLVAASQAAQPYGQVPQGSIKPSRKPSYTPTPPSYAAAATASAATTTGRSTSLESKMSQLARNDHQQDQRLYSLERDVKTLKPKTGLPATPPPYEAAALVRVHTVRSGETLWRIAARYNTSVNAIRMANRMSGDTVTVGQTLEIPGDEAPNTAPVQPAVHVVRAGETFSAIAQRYKVTQDALARVNPSAYPDRLLVGERLAIPGAKSLSVPTFAAPPASPATADSRQVHIVRAGESLGAIAKKYGMSTASLATANRLKNPDLVEVGRKLVIPAGPAPAAAPTSLPPTGRLVRHNLPSPDADLVPLPGAGLAAFPGEATRPSTSRLPAPLPEPLPAPAPTPAPASTPATGDAPRGVVAYRLEKGDDINTVASVFGTTAAKIRELNLMGPTDNLKEGQEIVVPALAPIQ